ncbi:MAG TPA: response regulator [Myxococcales bacterium]|nr:response regulator [Myxococcales bacterium]
MNALRIVLVDDHVLFRAGLRALLEAIAGIQVAGEASDGREGLKVIAEKKPDLVAGGSATAGAGWLLAGGANQQGPSRHERDHDVDLRR